MSHAREGLRKKHPAPGANLDNSASHGSSLCAMTEKSVRAEGQDEALKPKEIKAHVLVGGLHLL